MIIIVHRAHAPEKRDLFVMRRKMYVYTVHTDRVLAVQTKLNEHRLIIDILKTAIAILMFS